MKTVQDEIVDSATRHSVYTLRWAKGTYKKQANLIDKLFADLSYKLAVRAPGDNSFTAKRLEVMLANVETLSNEMFGALSKAVNGDLRELAAYESKFQVASLQNAYPIEMVIDTVPASQIYSATMSRPFQGKILKDWWKSQNAATQDAYNRAIRLGYAQGETLGQITSRLRGVNDMTHRQVEAIVRTATKHLAQTARSEMIKNNQGILEDQEMFIATLDGRTTLICAGNDGKLYDLGKGPMPPLHYGCRSDRVPVTKSWSQLGLNDLKENDKLHERRYIADQRRFVDIPKDQRDSVVGSTTLKSYNDWLKTQPRSFVDDVLGKEKAKLYMDGGLHLDKFTDRNGNELTLKKLAEKEAKAFKKAGVEL